jgi:hypothetical protein
MRRRTRRTLQIDHHYVWLRLLPSHDEPRQFDAPLALDRDLFTDEAGGDWHVSPELLGARTGRDVTFRKRILDQARVKTDLMKRTHVYDLALEDYHYHTLRQRVQRRRMKRDADLLTLYAHSATGRPVAIPSASHGDGASVEGWTASAARSVDGGAEQVERARVEAGRPLNSVTSLADGREAMGCVRFRNEFRNHRRSMRDNGSAKRAFSQLTVLPRLGTVTRSRRLRSA